MAGKEQHTLAEIGNVLTSTRMKAGQLGMKPPYRSSIAGGQPAIPVKVSLFTTRRCAGKLQSYGDLMTVIDGRWKILKPLAEGGQGHAFIVRDLSNGSEGWVLKRLKNRRPLERFEREIEALAAITSTHIPAVHAHSLDEPAYVVTPFLGSDLTKHPNTWELDIEEILDVFSQIVTAISDAHGAGVIHRDVKPNNVVMGDIALHAYVIDFGICQYSERQLRSLTTDEPLGSPSFAAPECFVGSEDDPTPASDVYSLGKVLYWLSSRGRFILRERVTEDVLSGIVGNSSVERECIARLVRHCVREDPGQRLSTVALQNEIRGAQRIVSRTRHATAIGLLTLVDRFGADDGFYPNGCRSATTAPRGNPPGRQELATSFIQSEAADVRVHSLTLVLGGRGSSLTKAHVALLGDLEGAPDDTDLLEDFIINVGPVPTVYEAKSQKHPRLRAASRYWVRLSVNDPNAEVAWWVAPIEFIPQSETFAERQERGAWRVANSPGGPGHALRVLGRPIP
jgi:protein kinase-like protein